jgi:hypothetical protein
MIGRLMGEKFHYMIADRSVKKLGAGMGASLRRRKQNATD